MNSGLSNGKDEAWAPGRGARWAPWVILGTVCALVISLYAWSAKSGWWEKISTPRADDAYYNLLVRGFRAGQLNLKMEVPAGFAQLADPYDPMANAHYREDEGHPLWDLSYYHGKMYLYFGVTPALVLFWPYAALTGHYLGHKDAVAVFCAMGFLASVGLLCLVWRRYFPEIGPAVVAAGALALGLVPFTPIILSRANIYEVAISCGYAMTMLTLLPLWWACHRPNQRGRWLAAASLAYGLAVVARPNLLFGAVILLVPVVQAWREGRRIWVPLLAATGPITIMGLGLLLYNTLRFDNPLDFGTRHQLAGMGAAQLGQNSWRHHFRSNFLRGFRFNSWVYFLAPARWGAHFPFVHDIQLPPLPAAYAPDPEHPFGVLSNIPLVWLTMAAPLAWRGRPADMRRLLRGYLVAVALLFASSALALVCFPVACVRYEMDFCPALVLLAVVGILGLERALADRPAWRRAARWAWGLLLAFSLAFNLLASTIRHAEYHTKLGTLLLERGHVNEAVAHLQKAEVLRPDDAGAHYNLGTAFDKQGQRDEAIRQLQEAIRLNSDHADAHYSLGTLLLGRGQVNEAIAHFQKTVALRPDDAGAQKYLGALLLEHGQVNEAMAPLQKTVALRPDDAVAHYNLGIALDQQEQRDEAIRHLQEAIRLKPDYADAHNNLGTVLDKQGKIDEAIRHYQEAIRFKPDYADAYNNLGADLDEKGQSDEATRHYQEAIRLKPNHADAHNNLGAALFTKGHIDEAISQFQETVRLNPAHSSAHNNLGLALGRKGQTDEAIREFQEAIRLKPDYAEARRNLDAVLAAGKHASAPPGPATNR